MLKVLVAFDNSDESLGDYFEESKNNSTQSIVDLAIEHDCHEIPSNRCNIAYIDITLPQYNQAPFIFLNYSHGSSSAILSGNVSYVSQENVYLFSNCFAYIISCEVALNLGKKFIENNALAFIGFDRSTNALRGQYQSLSINCDNYAFLLFLNGYSLTDACEGMKKNYTAKADYLLNIGELLKAADLIDCRDALTLFGNGALKLADFMN